MIMDIFNAENFLLYRFLKVACTLFPGVFPTYACIKKINLIHFKQSLAHNSYTVTTNYLPYT